MMLNGAFFFDFAVTMVGSDWKPAAPVPNLRQTWVVGVSESPGLRLTRSPAGAAVIPAKGSAKPK